MSDNSPSEVPLRPCVICGDESPRKHLNYGAEACLSCRAFFRRVVSNGDPSELICKGQQNESCSLTTTTRRRCRKCRYDACVEAGMKVDSVLTKEQICSRFKSPSFGGRRRKKASDDKKSNKNKILQELFAVTSYSQEGDLGLLDTVRNVLFDHLVANGSKCQLSNSLEVGPPSQIPLRITLDEEKMLDSRVNHLHFAVNSVSLGNSCIKEYILHTFKVPLSASFRKLVFHAYIERLRRVLQSSAVNIPDTEVRTVLGANMLAGSSILSAVLNANADPQIQMEFMFGTTDKIRFKDEHEASLITNGTVLKPHQLQDFAADGVVKPVALGQKYVETVARLKPILSRWDCLLIFVVIIMLQDLPTGTSEAIKKVRSQYEEMARKKLCLIREVKVEGEEEEMGQMDLPEFEEIMKLMREVIEIFPVILRSTVFEQDPDTGN